MTSKLPVEVILSEVASAVAAGRNVVVEAPPGAGKTTLIPKHLLEREVARDREILVLQPRRIAARAAARFVAASLGEPVGERCGYRVRFEAKAGPRTRLCFVTEALLLRRMREAPTLPGVGIIVFDELHERHLATDLGLALARRLQHERPDDAPRIVAMSATLDAEPVAAFLDAVRLRSEGRAFPVELRFAQPARRSERARPPRIEDEVRAALRARLAEQAEGHVLAFLPGMAEIRACERSCGELAAQHGLEVHALHGALSNADQDRALGDTGARKLVLATNVAETSLTIDGVLSVIDTGLARVARDDPWTGLPTLELERISRASAAQRAGRAGRTAPGTCIRLYTQHDHDERPAFTPPEIARLELADLTMDVLAAGVADPEALDWLDPPPAAALERARTLLRALGAIGPSGLTDTGRAMLRLPVHPRHARLLVEAKRRGVASRGAAAVALLSEGPLRRRGERGAEDGDLLDEVHALDDLGRHPERRRTHGVDGAALRRIAMLRDQLTRQLSTLDVGTVAQSSDGDAADAALRIAIAAGHPDHVARVRRGEAGPDSAVFAGGGAAELAASQTGTATEWIVALSVERRREGRRETTRVRRCVQIEPEWLLDLFADRIEEVEDVRFDPTRERVEGRSELRYGGLVLASSPIRGVPPEAAAKLREAALSAGAASFVRDPDALRELLARSALVAEHVPGFQALDEADAESVLTALTEGARSFADLRAADLLSHLRARLGPHAAKLDTQAPSAISLPGRRRVPVHYERDKPPWIASRMQDFFGLAEGPRIVDGRVPLVLHLLAPNARAEQVTTDLAGFWQRHYPALRKSLMRRYPRHAWPEDPLAAAPPRRRGRGR